MSVACRPATPEDEPFLRTLILETIARELGASAWPQPMREHLLGIQYQGRRYSWRAMFPDAANSVIESDGANAGWLVIAELAAELRLIEIIVSESAQRQGIGTAVVSQLLGRAVKPVRLHVNATNTAAIRLYQRLGFRRISGDEVQHFLEFQPGA